MKVFIFAGVEILHLSPFVHKRLHALETPKEKIRLLRAFVGK